jgi:hypothetical protein
MIPGGSLAPQTVVIRKSGPGSLAWTLSKSTADGGNWLGVSAQQGTAPSRGPLSFTMQSGGPNPPPQALNLASTGSAIRFTPFAATGKGGNWLQVSPQGVGCCTTPQSATVSVTAPGGLAPGNYTGQITFVQYPANMPTMTVPIYLTVQ